MSSTGLQGAKQARDLSSREGAVNEQSLPSSALHLFFLKHGFIFTTTQSREQSAKQSALSKAECKAGRRTRTKQMHACQSVTKAASCAVVTSWWEWSFRAFGASCIIGIACSTAATNALLVQQQQRSTAAAAKHVVIQPS